MNRRLVRCALASLVIVLAGVSSANAQTKVTFGDQQSLTMMVVSVGIEKGFFREQGLEVTQAFGQRGSDTILAAMAGKIEFGFSSITPFLAATSQGAELVAVGVFSHGYSGHLVASLKNADLKTLEDFRGKRVGMQRGTGVATVFQIAIRNLGMKESDFEITNLRVSDMPTAMQGGSFDAVVGWEPNMSRIVTLGYGMKAISPEAFEGFANITYVFPLFATREMVEKQPDVVQKFVNGFAKAQQFANTQRAASLKITRESLGEVVNHMSDQELEDLSYVYQKDRVAFADADLNDFRVFADFMLESGQIEKIPDLSEIIDGSFALKAEQAIKAKQ